MERYWAATSDEIVREDPCGEVISILRPPMTRRSQPGADQGEIPHKQKKQKMQKLPKAASSDGF